MSDRDAKTRPIYTPTSPHDSDAPVAVPPSGSEKALRRVGGWAKRLALLVYVHGATSRLSLSQSVALYVISTYVSVYKILHDVQNPYGSRLYICNLAGDDAAMHTVRSLVQPLPWADVLDDVRLFHRLPWHRQAIECSAVTVYRNRYTLGMFWGYTLFWRLYRWVSRRGKGPSLLKSLFPHGIVAWTVQMGRTAGLLGTYALAFWTILAACAKCRINTTGFTRLAATNMVTVAAILALPVEVPGRWRSMAAFMAMSIFD
eukprot:m.199938 g.199938  ORF g.199938 m.199938 type:complete len:259 (+) comp20908_c0_seq1:97-873(+)